MPNTAKTSTPPPRDAPTPPLNCSIFITDIVGYSDPRRDDYDRAVLRTTLWRVLTDAFTESGLNWRRCHHHDRGDGLLTVVPPTLSTSLLIEPLLSLLGESISRHNRGATDRLQLRSAVHVGPVALGDTGYPNASVIHAARMVDSDELRYRLDGSGQEFATMVSSYVYENVVRHVRGAVRADSFQRSCYQLGNVPITSWVYVSQQADNGGRP
ncbi:hypothetical protein ACIA5G_33495 [Amycolatopsis sp. NPDC051758]|uniref:hypothetical protein n=1 Tax=Amycolatopsis sp. NPDC051758 TaxID=3363935 RepID=UPI00378F5A6E